MRVAPIETPVPYPLYAFCGLLTWNFFASALRFSVTSLTSNANLVTKVYFPREVFPFSAIAVCAVDLAVGATVLVGLMIYYDVGVSPALLFLPVVIVMHIAFTAGVALLLAMANLFYRDVKYLFEVVITVWMFATSAVFPVDRVGGWLGVAINLNPMTHFIDAYRAVLLYHRLPDPVAFLSASVAAVLMLAVSWYVFHLAEFTFAESI
jgi:ABC-type polysaccharide/polyol phosphate export permease